MTFLMTRSKVTKTEVRKFKKMRENGASYAEVAKATGRNIETVRCYCSGELTLVLSSSEVLVVRTLKKLRKKFPRKQTIGCKLVAAEVGMSHQWVAKLLKRLRIPEQRRKFPLSSGQNMAEDPVKVYWHGRFQGWC